MGLLRALSTQCMDAREELFVCARLNSIEDFNFLSGFFHVEPTKVHDFGRTRDREKKGLIGSNVVL